MQIREMHYNQLIKKLILFWPITKKLKLQSVDTTKYILLFNSIAIEEVW